MVEKDIDRRISDPHFSEAFLSWYEGIYDQVYIALHPFSKVGDIDPEDVQYQTAFIDRNQIEGPLTFEKYAQLSHAASANKLINKTEFASVQKRQGQRITWKAMCEACNIDSLSRLNRLLMTKIQAVKHTPEDTDHIETLTKYCQVGKIFFPTEDEIHPLLEAPLVTLMQKLGLLKIWLSNEFNENKQVQNLSALDTEGPWNEANDLGFKIAKAYDTNNTFLAVVPWDNFYTVLCGKGTALSDAGVETSFEGFWCTPDTKPEW